MKHYTNKEDELIIKTNGTLVSFTNYNSKSYRFEATTEDFGIIEGFVAKSLDLELESKVGKLMAFGCPRDILNGTDPTLETPEPTNWLWSISKGTADTITDSMLDAINAL